MENGKGRPRGGGRRATSQFNLKFLPGERELIEKRSRIAAPGGPSGHSSSTRP
jgi:hypothetical protein